MQARKQSVERQTASGPGRSSASSAQAPQEKSLLLSTSSISLPKGGGAIHGIGEKFASNHTAETASSPATPYHHGYFDGEERGFRGFDRPTNGG
jgi:hypothetical protein